MKASCPGGGRADLFLPDRLRGALGLEDSERRYAQDNYALNLLAASRRLQLVAGRRGPEGDPLIPSRLLFACDADGDELAQQARAFWPTTREPACIGSGRRTAGGKDENRFRRSAAGPPGRAGHVATGDRAARLPGLPLSILSAASARSGGAGRRGRGIGRQRFRLAAAHRA